MDVSGLTARFVLVRRYVHLPQTAWRRLLRNQRLNHRGGKEFKAEGGGLLLEAFDFFCLRFSSALAQTEGS
jgi:hypothetical protein